MPALEKKETVSFLKKSTRLVPLPHIDNYLLKICRPPTASEIINTVARAKDDELVVLHYINKENKTIDIQLSEQFSITPTANSLELKSQSHNGTAYLFFGKRIFSITLARSPSGRNKRDLMENLLQIRENWSFSSDQMRQNIVPAAAISPAINIVSHYHQLSCSQNLSGTQRISLRRILATLLNLCKL